MNPLFRAKPVTWIYICTYLLLLGGIYYSTFTWLIVHDWRKEDYTYGYLIVPTVIYLLWGKRAELRELSSVPSCAGLVPLGFGICLFWLGELGGEYFTLYISFWLILVGLCWIHLGWKKIKNMAFPLFITLTMFPLPDFLYTKISLQLQLLSSKLGVDILQLYGMPAYREGNVIDLGFTQLQVVEACSGLRYLIPLIIMGIILAHFFRAALWKRIVLVISTLPLAIFTNSMRIALTGIISEIWGTKSAEGFFHGFSGWLIFIFCLALLLAEIWLLDKIPYSRSNTPDGEKFAPHTEKTGIPPKEDLVKHSFWKPGFIAASILLGTTLVLSQGIDFREKIPIKEPLDHFPLKVGEWLGTRQTFSQEIIDTLDLSDYAVIEYRNSTGKAINFYVAYYESQRKGQSIHTPATCLPGSGWFFEEAGTTCISIPGYHKGSIPVNRAHMRKLGYRQLSYFWFLQRGRFLTSAYQLKIFAFWDALTKRRTDGALVRIITPIYESERLIDAETRLQGFTRLIIPILGDYIPGDTLG
jgi:exosortase D (VPLPA-CTERM-specific)